MNTPPPEETFKPDPYPSVSTPCFYNSSTSPNDATDAVKRQRRHTVITRPDDRDEEETQSFDRISGILSNLIREANDAVNGIEQERGKLWQHRRAALPPRPTTPHDIRLQTRLPRPSRPMHERNDSTCSTSSSVSSCSSLMTSPQQPPISSPTTTDTSISRSPSPLVPKQRLSSGRPLSCPTLVLPRKSGEKKRTSLLLESFKRLDSSMALVDSLSRDLATQEEKEQHHDPAFNIMFLVPILHIPHALITILFDTTSNGVPSMTGIVAWACLFALGNLMVDHVATSDTPKTPTRRLSLPGSYCFAGRNTPDDETTMTNNDYDNDYDNYNYDHRPSCVQKATHETIRL